MSSSNWLACVWRGESSYSHRYQRRNVETNPCRTYRNRNVQERSKGINFLAKHAQSDRGNGLKLSNLLTVLHIQCAKRAHDITRIPGIRVASCGSTPISDWCWALSFRVGLPQQIFWVGKNVQHYLPRSDKQNKSHICTIWHPGKGSVR